MTKHWSDFHSVNPSNSHSLNLVTLPLNPTVTSYINSARSAARSTAEARNYRRSPETNCIFASSFRKYVAKYPPLDEIIYLLKARHPRCVQLYRMETFNQIRSVYFAHLSYMLRLPQCSHHQAVQRIIKRKLFTLKLWTRCRPYKNILGFTKHLL